MRSGKELRILIPSAIGLAVLILDGGTAIEGAKSGLDVCIQTVLPSLFPFIFITSILSPALSAVKIKGNSFLSRLYGIPNGAEGILLSGLLGGYPIGAKCIDEAVAAGELSLPDGERMLPFCNAAGPAFIFGIIGSIFEERWIPWCLWGIHLLSGLCIARLFKYESHRSINKVPADTTPITSQLRRSVKVMSEICGWIILMRTVIAIAQKWCLWYMPAPLQILISGILELSNGCIALMNVSNTGLQFLLSSVFTGFGGLCVALQTGSAASNLRRGLYLPGKILQGMISFIIAYIVQLFTFRDAQQVHLPWLFYPTLLSLIAVCIYSVVKKKKVVAFS